MGVPVVLLLLTILLFSDFLFSDGMLFGTDTIPMGYSARKAYSDLLREHGELPLWNPYILGGIPMVDGLMGGDMFYPTTLLQFIMPVHRAIGLKLVIHIFLAGLLFYFYARENRASRGGALVGGVGYAFAPYIVSLIYAGHDGKLFVTALLPLGFLALDRLLKRARVADAALFGISIGLLILTAHLQLAFFACWAFGLRYLWKMVGAWREGRRGFVLRVTILFMAGAILGAAAGAVQTLPAYEYTSTYSPRAGGVTYEFATSWSIHWEEAVSLFLPEFGNYLDFYWGENAFKLNCESPGLLILFLVIAGFFLIQRNRELLFWYAVLGLSMIYALGGETPLFHLIYAIVPKFFRAPSTILFLFSFSSAVIASQVLTSALSGDGMKSFLRGTAVASGILLLLLISSWGGETFFRAWGDVVRGGLSPQKLQVAAGNAANIQTGALIGLLAIALFSALVYYGRRKRWPAEAVFLGLALLVFLSNVRTDRDFIKTVRMENYFREDSLIRMLQSDPDVFRVLSAIPNYQDNYLMAFGIEGARGFFDNKVKWYDELTATNLNNLDLLGLLNVKYILASPPGINHAALEEVGREGNRILYRNTLVLPRAFLVESWETVLDREILKSRVLDQKINKRQIVFLDEEAGIPFGGDRPISTPLPVEWIETGPNRYSMKVTAERSSVLFLSNNWLPYWKATVDGEEKKLLRANFAFQGVALTKGEHEVLLTYRSEPFESARIITFCAAILLIGSGSGAWFRGRKKENHNE